MPDRLKRIRETHPHCDKELTKALDSLPGRSLPCDMCWLIERIEKFEKLATMWEDFAEYNTLAAKRSGKDRDYVLAEEHKGHAEEIRNILKGK